MPRIGSILSDVLRLLLVVWAVPLVILLIGLPIVAVIALVHAIVKLL